MNLKSSQIKQFRIDLLAKQGGRSALSGQVILEGEAVLDHCHKTGLVRGVITRAENSVLGKVENGRRFGRSFDAVAFAKGLENYLTKIHDDVIHPVHLAKQLKQRKPARKKV